MKKVGREWGRAVSVSTGSGSVSIELQKQRQKGLTEEAEKGDQEWAAGHRTHHLSSSQWKHFCVCRVLKII